MLDKVMKDSTQILLVVMLALVVLAVVPLAVIWGLNVLFPALAIPYSWKTWGAVAVLMLALKPSIKVTR